MNSAVIFGAAGQDGSFLTELLLSKGYQVTAVVRHSSKDYKTRLADIVNDDVTNLDIVIGDVTDKTSVEDIINYTRPDECYNLAAQSQVALSFQMPEYTFNSIYNGTVNILNALVKYSAHTKYYQASSSEMFGLEKGIKTTSSRAVAEDGVLEFVDIVDYTQNEECPFKPCSPYGVAKVAAHHITQVYRNAHDLHASCGILFNHESERRGELFVTKKITKYLGKYFQGDFNDNMRPNLELGNLDASRDWGYAEEYVEAMWLMLQQDTPDDYVIATGETHTVKDFVEAAFRNVGELNWSAYVDISDELKRPVEVPRLCGDASKAKEVLGWVPRVTFHELILIMLRHDAPQKFQEKEET